MRVRKIFAWLGVLVLALVIGAGTTGYILSTMEPASYAPVSLSDQQQTEVAQEFLSHRLLDGFGNRVEEGRPFTWSIRDREVNDILASMDEIAYQLDGRGDRSRPVEQALREQEVSSPAVLFQPGRITLMIFSDTLRRVLSADVGVSLDARGRLRVAMEGARVGRLTIPVSILRDELETLRQALPDEVDAAARGAGISGAAIPSPEDFVRFLQQILVALDGEAIDPVLVWPGNKRPVRVTGLHVTDGELTIQFTPL